MPPRDERPSAGDRLVELWRNAETPEEREECFRQIYLLFYRMVLRYFGRRGFPDDESKDLTQDTFQNHVAGAAAPASAPTTALNDPILNIKGGGGLSGGVIASKDYLNQAGGGGLSGGVIAS